MKRIGVLTSGGDAPGMNAAIRAVVRSALSRGWEVFGVKDGYRGLIYNDMTPMNRSSVSEIIIRGGTILGSARSDEFKELEGQKQAVKNLAYKGIEALVCIGGDGTYKGAKALTDLGINCISLPGTIDNDVAATDFSIGFDTALMTIVENVAKLRDTSSSHHRCFVVEVMGNHCGDLAIWSGITSGAEMVITKETGFDLESTITRLNEIERVKKKHHAIVIISEKLTNVYDLAQEISNRTGFSGRATILGHIQRGGAPTANDRMLASKMGDFAVQLLAEDKGGLCVNIINNQLVALDINEAVNMEPKSRKPLFDLLERLI